MVLEKIQPTDLSITSQMLNQKTFVGKSIWHSAFDEYSLQVTLVLIVSLL